MGRRAVTCGILTAWAIAAHADLTTNLGSVADTGLFEHNPTNNLGSKTYVIVGNIGTGERSRALFRFNMTEALPANATVTAASLTLNVPVPNGFGQDFELHRVLKDWGEGTGSGGGGHTGGQGSPANPGEATWKARFHPATLWDTAGGQSDSDFVAAASATATMGTTLTFSSGAMAADIQMWLNTSGTNFGWMLLKAVEDAGASHVATREDAANGPVLTVSYTLPSPPSSPQIFGAGVVGSAFAFSFNAESNRNYAVEFVGALPNTNWSVLTNIGPLPAPATVPVSDSLTTSNRFYRLRTQ